MQVVLVLPCRRKPSTALTSLFSLARAATPLPPLFAIALTMVQETFPRCGLHPRTERFRSLHLQCGVFAGGPPSLPRSFTSSSTPGFLAPQTSPIPNTLFVVSSLQPVISSNKLDNPLPTLFRPSPPKLRPLPKITSPFPGPHRSTVVRPMCFSAVPGI